MTNATTAAIARAKIDPPRPRKAAEKSRGDVPPVNVLELGRPLRVRYWPAQECFRTAQRRCARIPAAPCGVVGLKPTFGRVSVRGVSPLSWNLDPVGPMARRASDLAPLLLAVAGFDPGDTYSVDIAVDDYVSDLVRGVEGWRVSFASEASVEAVERKWGGPFARQRKSSPGSERASGKWASPQTD